MKNLFHKLLKINFRSVFLNFYLLPFKQAVFLPLLFNRNVKIQGIYGGVQLNSKKISPGMIQIGYECAGIIDNKFERTLLDISSGGKILFNGKCFIGSGSRLSVHGNLEFGSDVVITGRSDFICLKNIKISSDSLISWDCIFMDTDFHKIFCDENFINENKSVFVGKNSWIGCRCTVLKGSKIPAGAVVGAGSIVSGNLEKENCVYAGNPAKLVKENIRWER